MSRGPKYVSDVYFNSHYYMVQIISSLHYKKSTLAFKQSFYIFFIFEYLAQYFKVCSTYPNEDIFLIGHTKRDFQSPLLVFPD